MTGRLRCLGQNDPPAPISHVNPSTTPTGSILPFSTDSYNITHTIRQWQVEGQNDPPAPISHVIPSTTPTGSILPFSTDSYNIIQKLNSDRQVEHDRIPLLLSDPSIQHRLLQYHTKIQTVTNKFNMTRFPYSHPILPFSTYSCNELYTHHAAWRINFNLENECNHTLSQKYDGFRIQIWQHLF